jgi:hypothetical protein
MFSNNFQTLSVDNIIHREVIKIDNTDNNSLSNGLNLLAESIECVERDKEEEEKERLDMPALIAWTILCRFYVMLQIFSQKLALQQKSQRVGRSTILETYKHNIDRYQKSTAAQNNIKECIAKKVSKDKKQDKLEMMPRQPNIDDMDAWELELGIKMAEKQRKYNEINKKL